MKLRELLDKWSLDKLKVSTGFLDFEFQPNDQEKDAAWAMYIELVTRVTTQALIPEGGNEVAALSSIHSLFGTTRTILREPGRRHANQFAKIAIVILNQKIRPFTTAWHKAALNGALEQEANRKQFRKELAALQVVLCRYAGLLADLAGIEDLTLLDAADIADPLP